MGVAAAGRRFLKRGVRAVAWCNLLPWGWYGEWEQDDDEAKATLERWVMGVRSRRNGAHRGRA